MFFHSPRTRFENVFFMFFIIQTKNPQFEDIENADNFFCGL